MLPRLAFRAPLRPARSSLRPLSVSAPSWTPCLTSSRGPRYLKPTSLASIRWQSTEPRRVVSDSRLVAPSATAVSPVRAVAPIPKWAEKLPKSLEWTHPYLSLARMDKPIGTWLLYWPCAWGITMAAYSSALPVSGWAWNLALFGTGAIVMRGAGCTINDLWDRDIDKKVDRTKLRPLASGEIKPLQALTFLGGQLSVGLAILTQLNWYSIALGASSLSLVVLYPLMKRITYWPQFVLGLAFNWGALLGSSAVLGATDWKVALPLYAGSVAWTIVYDTIYAHQDKKDDVDAGVKSTALLFAERSRPILTGFSVSFVSLLALSGYLNAQGPAFYALSVGGAAAHLAWQLRNADLESRENCWEMFKSNRDLGAIVWSGLAVDYALKMATLA
ncbi:putative 4-hydroxybenzoate polyprenyltransferase [Rhodotorula taiwanensis]|uniref:4-hydroxybenzoate polyprenyltransferase, mitochondrial n=1 Tax=Rhodotorula taiwanensis TaxID=741276 RepID=A0A2S5BCD5_9BASI|nr:putative 4-hydroxybenzoate polyprenyltransferase [Rhodotorula taiwanensis]